MRSTDLLREQHRALEKVLSRALATKGPEHIGLLGRLAEELTLHAALEEEYLYPALEQNGMEDASARSLREHRRIASLVAEILELKRNDPRLEAKLSELAQAAREHFAHEEQALFPAVEQAFRADQLEAMGVLMHSAADRLRSAELLKIAEDRELAGA